MRLPSCCLASLLAALAAPAPAQTEADPLNTAPDNGRWCSGIHTLLDQACRGQVEVDHAVASATCLNLVQARPASKCRVDALVQRNAGQKLCKQQKPARAALCATLGEARFDPPFAPADFEKDFANPARPNRYFPLVPGQEWKFQGGDETVTVKVLNKTKNIRGVNCIVVQDREVVDGTLAEDTFDWFALRRDGTVYYCGESSRNFTLYKGDRPQEAELVDTHGSWKAGRNGALPGYHFLARPARGETYRQEFAAGSAEDVATVVSTRYRHGDDADLDQQVPADLARYLCSSQDCIVIQEYSPLEPGKYERKYYAVDIGLFLETDPSERSHIRLIECNVSPRCSGLAALPAP